MQTVQCLVDANASPAIKGEVRAATVAAAVAAPAKSHTVAMVDKSLALAP